MEWIKTQIQSWADKGYINGATVAESTSSGVNLFCRGVYAPEEPYSKKAILPDALFDLASLTKVVGTTTRVLQFFGEGLLQPTDLINPYLPFSMVPIQIGDLLLHRSGLPADLEDKPLVSSAYMKTFFETWSPLGKPLPTYSDLGYLLLGYMIESMDQCDLETSFKTHIFTPLEMYHTTFFPKALTENEIVPSERTDQRGLIVGEVHDSKAWKLQSPAGSAGLFSTVNDLIRFSRLFFNPENPVLSPQIIKELVQINVNQRTYGWERLGNASSRPILFHTGFTGTSIGIDIEYEKALILLTNRVYYDRDHVEFINERRALYEKYFNV